ncbi:MAG: hypothetical protein IJS89_07490 [Bacteroidaceae bacterium]|nr:hypothetical protein [Bacteroidaceae bacterium]
MKRITLFVVVVLTLTFAACGGKTEDTKPSADSVVANDHFIGETEADHAASDTLTFKSLSEAIASIADERDVYGVWSHEVGGEVKTYFLIYRDGGMYWLRNVRVDGKLYRLDDEKQSVQLKAVNKVEFQDLQNGGGYRLTDSTLVVYDAQNYAEELGRRVFDWND